MSVRSRWQGRLKVRRVLLAAAKKRAAAARKMVKRRQSQVGAAKRVLRRHPAKAKHSGPATGIDISNNNGIVGMVAVAHAGHKFVFAKASEGTGFRDRYFTSNVAHAKAAGLLVGGYHFLHHGNATAQADLFLSMVKGTGCTLRPVVDVEIQGVTEADVAEFVARVKSKLGVTPLIYTSPAFMRWSSTHGCGLWVANYGVSAPSIPAPWGDYVVWQHSSTAKVPGVHSNCDVNRCPDLSKITV